jgi:cell division protein DivIC
MGLLKQILAIVTNKFFLVTALFLSWILFFANNNLIEQYAEEKEYKQMREKIDYLEQEIKGMRQQQEKLKSDPKYLEQFAREHYRMKKEGETIFVFDTVAAAPKK